MNTLQIFAEIVAGLGLFFIGIKLISHNLKQMAGQKTRALIMGLTKNRTSSVFCGVFLGAVAQSTSAVTFIVASMMSAGLVTVKRCIPIISWANVGNSALVLVATLDIRVFVLYLIGAVGAAYFFGLEKSQRFRYFVATMLGVGLLFLGLLEIKLGSSLLQGVDWFNHLILYSRDSYFLILGVGALLAILAQSSTTVSVVAIAMTDGGLFNESQIILLIYGANLGSGINFLILSSSLKGRSRQLGYLQVLLKLSGAFIFIPLLFIENYTGIPLVKAFILSIPVSLAMQMAILFALYQVVVAAIITVGEPYVEKLLNRLSPPTLEEDLAQFQYIYEQAVADPPTALELIDKEQMRVLSHFPEYVDSIRVESTEHRPLSVLHNASGSVLKEIDHFAIRLTNENVSGSVLDRLFLLQNRNELLIAIEESLHELATIIQTRDSSGTLDTIFHNLAESLHFLLLTLSDALAADDTTDFRLLTRMTEDRGKLMEEMRKTLLDTENGLTYEEQTVLYSVTSRFERIVWLIRRITHQKSNAVCELGV